MDRRILGTEKIRMKDGTEVETNVYSVSYAEKMKLVRKYTEVKLDKGYQYKVIDEVAIRDEIMKIALSDINFDDLDFFADEIYDKYFLKSEDSKKEKTSSSGQTDTNSQETVTQ